MGPHTAVAARRDSILNMLQAAPSGLTREAVAEELGVSVADAKYDLLTLRKLGRVVCRSGGRAPGSTNGYLRLWHATPPAQPQSTTRLYDALHTTLAAGVPVALTIELLEKLRAELAP